MKKLRDERRLSFVGNFQKHQDSSENIWKILRKEHIRKLPADVYTKGFLRSYAIFMGLNESQLVKQFEREKGIHRNIKKSCGRRQRWKAHKIFQLGGSLPR